MESPVLEEKPAVSLVFANNIDNHSQVRQKSLHLKIARALKGWNDRLRLQ